MGNSFHTSANSQGNSNMQFGSCKIKKGSIVKICHDSFTRGNSVPNDLMFIDKKAKVLHLSKMMKARPDAPDILIAHVVLENGAKEVYPLSNLEFLQ